MISSVSFTGETVIKLLFQIYIYLSAIRLLSILLYILSALLHVLLNLKSKTAILFLREGGVSHEGKLQPDRQDPVTDPYCVFIMQLWKKQYEQSIHG